MSTNRMNHTCQNINTNTTTTTTTTTTTNNNNNLSKADHPWMRPFSYTQLLPITQRRRRECHSIHRSQKDYALHANFTGVCVTEAELLAMEFSFCRSKVILAQSFTLWQYALSTFLLLWPWPWPDDLHILT